MVKHTQTIRQQQPTNCLSVFDYFVGLELKGLKVVHIGEVARWVFPTNKSNPIWGRDLGFFTNCALKRTFKSWILIRSSELKSNVLKVNHIKCSKLITRQVFSVEKEQLDMIISKFSRNGILKRYTVNYYNLVTVQSSDYSNSLP